MDRDGRRDEEGFTLLEILIAMIVLALGGVSILSLFAAAVKLQYDAVVDQRKAVVLAEVVAEAQDVLNRYEPTEADPLPPDPKVADHMKEWSKSNCPQDFTVKVSYSRPPSFAAGEGALANITLYFRDNEVESIRHILQRTVFTEKEIELSVTEKEDEAARKAAESGGGKE